MTRVSFRSKLLLLLLAVLLALPWSLAAEPRRAAAPRLAAQASAPPVSLAVRFGSWLRSLWGEAGLDIDPNGVAAPPPAPGPAGRTEVGANIDPNGLQADTGLNIDPNG